MCKTGINGRNKGRTNFYLLTKIMIVEWFKGKKHFQIKASKALLSGFALIWVFKPNDYF